MKSDVTCVTHVTVAPWAQAGNFSAFRAGQTVIPAIKRKVTYGFQRSVARRVTFQRQTRVKVETSTRKHSLRMPDRKHGEEWEHCEVGRDNFTADPRVFSVTLNLDRRDANQPKVTVPLYKYCYLLRFSLINYLNEAGLIIFVI